jgi:hypothetical protein
VAASEPARVVRLDRIFGDLGESRIVRCVLEVLVEVLDGVVACAGLGLGDLAGRVRHLRHGIEQLVARRGPVAGARIRIVERPPRVTQPS